MKMRTATEQKDLDESADIIKGLGAYLPLVITITEGKRIRTDGQNRRYWSNLSNLLQEIRQAISQVSEHTGYSEFEVRKLVADELPIEQAAILFVRTPEAAHEILKMLVGIPTSTRLGTKAFSKFEMRLEQTMMEIIGNINAITRRAVS